jgi:beta-lactam-binding protein with PASTA domain
VTVSAPPIVVVTGQIPNVTCTSALAAQQAIEKAGFKFVGSFVTNTSYPNGTVFKTSPPAGTAPVGSEVTAFVATGPAPSGRLVINPCLLILQTINPGLLHLATPTPTP